ncbi:MAG TPA: DUF120 domain-containing protein [Thermoplasmata archaeon]|nr:DUF120 domain-containing protein [Thermoplasmata archaeon]
MPSARGATGPKGHELAILKLVAGLAQGGGPIVVTSREVGEKVGISQQAADRYLVALEKRALLARRMAARRQQLTITPKGLEALRREYEGYRRIFEGPATVRFVGTVQSGLGEGRYYLSQPGYLVQFSERLGYTPYPGTLNVGVPEAAVPLIGTLRTWTGVRIDGFQAGGRTFGGATCHRARLSGRVCDLIVPDRTHHQTVVEFIAAERLRDVLHVKDGDAIEAVLEGT